MRIPLFIYANTILTRTVPKLPSFSPKIQTSYQVYSQLHDRPAFKRSPPLRFSERLEDLEPPAQQARKFNPNAPAFAPSGYGSRQPSPLNSEVPFRPPAVKSERQSPANVQGQGPFSPPPYPDGREMGGEAMGRSGSGGVRVGGRVINFGDGLEGVVVDEARERAERGRERILEGRR